MNVVHVIDRACFLPCLAACSYMTHSSPATNAPAVAKLLSGDWPMHAPHSQGHELFWRVRVLTLCPSEQCALMRMRSGPTRV